MVRLMELPEASRRLMSGIPDFAMEVKVFPEGTKTAEDAAAAIGCPVAAIVKSLVFVIIDDRCADEPVVALVPGDLRLDTELGRGRRGTGHEGPHWKRSVRPPVTRPEEPLPSATATRCGCSPTRLRRHDPVWAAAGTPTTVFPISIDDLDRLASPIWTDIAIRNDVIASFPLRP